jgi:polyhydroxyalkanoate synthesis regulator phasin
MPQPKSTTRRKSAAKPASARKGGARKSTAGKKRSGAGASAKRGTTAKRSTAAKRSAAAKRGAAARGGASSAGGSPEDVVRANLKAFRDALASSVSQLNLMMVSRDRIQEVLDDAVRRGRVTRDDANEMVSDLVRRGRRQTDDLMKDLEQLLGRSRDQFEDATGDARKQARKGATRARRQPSVDRVLREVDRGRRAAGLPPSFPIIGYDDLSAAQVVDRLADLSPAELRKVRDYERRNANRKSVLTAIEKALA